MALDGPRPGNLIYRMLFPSYSRSECLNLIVLVVALGALTSACGSAEPEILPSTIDADRLLFERGTAALEDEDWLRAREYFTQVRDNYPQSPFRAESRLAVGDTFLGQGSRVAFVSAAAEFEDFLSVYPTHSRADYAQYSLGLVAFRQMRDPSRDQSYTLSALAHFEAFIERYPNSELMPKVRERLREAQDRLSASEVEVGRYYYRYNSWPGAISRLQSVLDEDPTYAGRDEVYFYLGASHRGEGSSAKALGLFERLVEEFPESEYSERAHEVLPELRAEAAADANDEIENVTPQSDPVTESETAAATTR